MACGFLDVAERDAGVECGGDERVAEGVGSDPLGDPGACGRCGRTILAGGMAVEALTVGAEEERTFAAFTDARSMAERYGARAGW